MVRRVVWTEPAWDDLTANAEYIARDSTNYAASFALEVKEAAASLARFSERSQIGPEFGDPAIRELLVRSYRLVYRISDEEVQILALVHGSRRIWRV